MHTRRPHQVSYTCEMNTLSCPSGRYTFDNVCRCTLAPTLSNDCNPDVPPRLNLTVEPGRLDGLLSHALPASTRRIKICGDMHYGMPRSAWSVPTREVATPRTIIMKYTQTNATDVGLPTPNDTKKAMPESVYGSTDSMTSVTTAKYEDAYSCPRCFWTFLPCRTKR